MKRLLKKIFNNKFTLILFSIFLFLGTITFSAFNVGESYVADQTDFDVPNITIKENEEANDGTWLFPNAGSIAGNVEVDWTDGMCGGGGSGTARKGGIYIEYTGNSEAIITFDYTITLNNGICRIDGQEIQSNNSFRKENVNNGDAISVYIESGSQKGQITSINITNFKVMTSDIVSLTLMEQENGDFALNDKTISGEYVYQTPGNVEFKLTAYPFVGYEFYGWSINGVISSYENPHVMTSQISCEIFPVFISQGSALFQNENKVFFNLDSAIENANLSNDKTIVLYRSGSISGGTSDNYKNYTINSGLTLLIPDNEQYKMYKDNKNFCFQASSYKKPTLFRELILLEYTNLIVEEGASVYVASIASGTMPYNAAPSNSYGQINLVDDSSNIILNNGSTLYCYGFIIGEGHIYSKNGSLVKELFQIADFRGGGVSMNMAGGLFGSANEQRVFLLSQYYIQNVECNIHYEYGSKETVATAADLTLVGLVSAETNFITNANADSGLFRLSQGSQLSKVYDGSEDRVYYTLETGTADLSSINLDLSALSVDSSDYVLPINSNMTITVKSGSVVNINQDLCFLPGSRLVIENGATVNISPGVSIFLYNRESWVGKLYTKNGDLYPVLYAPTKTYNRTSADLKNAVLDLNGTISISSNAGFYTTVSNEAISSTSVSNVFTSLGTGKIVYNGEPGNKSVTYQIEDNKEGNYKEINVSHLILRNSKNENSSSDDTFFDLRDVDSLNSKVVYYDSTFNIWKIEGSGQSLFNITFIDSVYGLPQYNSSYINGQEYTFPTADETGFIYDSFRVRKRRIEGIGLLDPGKSYELSLGRDVIAYAVWGGWTNVGSDEYYIDYYTGNNLVGLNRVENKNSSVDDTKIYLFNENGSLNSDFYGIYINSDDGNLYYIQGGEVQENAGLLKYFTDVQTSEFQYIYVSNNNTLFTNGTFYIDSTNGLLPSGYYTFDKNGYIIREDTDTINSNGEVYIKENKTYIDGIRVSYGLFDYNGYYYYSNNYGEIVTDQTFFIINVNDTGVQQGLYYFDEQGRMYNQNFELWEVNNAWKLKVKLNFL